MKKTIGYGYKLSSESITHALNFYSEGWLAKTKREVLIHIQNDKDMGDIPKNAKPKIFKVVVETE